MKKNTAIFIGLIAAAGIGYYFYNKNQKSKSVSGDMTPAERAKAEQDEAALAAKPDAEQRIAYSQDANELVDILSAPDYSELSFDGPAPATQGQSAGNRQDVVARQQAAAKLKDLIAKNTLTTEELKAIHDYVLAKKKKYPGKKSKGELNSSIHSIFHRYSIDLPETESKSVVDKAKALVPETIQKAQSALGLNVEKAKSNDKSNLNFTGWIR